MTTSSVTANTTASSSAATETTPANPSGALNQTDFLKLLVAQIQYQDPINPQSNTDMAAQLAQFTSLQQATQSSASLSMLQANGLVGSTVTVQVDSQNSASGIVTGASFSNGTPQITINGSNYNLSQVTSVAPAQVSNNPTASTP